MKVIYFVIKTNFDWHIAIHPKVCADFLKSNAVWLATDVYCIRHVDHDGAIMPRPI